MSQQLDQLANAGCVSAERHLKVVIPGYAAILGIEVDQAYDRVVEEFKTLQTIQTINHDDITESGVAVRFYDAFAKLMGDDWVSENIGDRTLMVVDNYSIWGLSRPDGHGNPRGPADVLDIKVKQQANDNLRPSMSIGRPDTTGELVLRKGFEPGDYDTAVRCLKRVIAAKEAGALPNLNSCGDGLWIPFDPTKYSTPPEDTRTFNLAGPLEYTSVVDPAEYF